ncbi:outer membrane beta-barrel protein [Aestuariibacter salexigens]|uniref:outer membrane beta-barrel protein n=1 Tax=Aestuariibacter salexigens TaxID=226010 RepID=UPI00047B0F7F|nr:outer membrane beta-barrel protein [Aestuariibacter salexigens]
MKIFTLAIFLLVTGQASAQWSAFASIGKSTAKHSVNITNAQVDNTDVSTSFGVRYQLSPRWYVAASWVDLGESQVSFSAITPDPETTLRQNAGQLALLASGVDIAVEYYLYSNDRWRMFAAASLFTWQSDVTLTSGNLNIEREIDGTDLGLSLGLSYQVSDRITPYLQVRRYWLDANDVDEMNLGIRIAF